jgi:putative CocE/NonD family hydrolase
MLVRGQTVEESGVKIPMRDGTLLDAMVWRPAAPGRYPVLVERVAYELIGRARANGQLYASHGYAVVAQNVRGSFASEGEFTLMRDDGWGERQDGYDTIEWAAAQPWSNGAVGMFDGSYSGSTQYMLAPSRPPHLRALFVRQSTGDLYRDWAYRGGAYVYGFSRRWTATSILAPQLGRRTGLLSEEASRQRIERAIADHERDLWTLPTASWPPIEGLADWYWDVVDHPEDGPFWHPVTMSRVVSEVDTPILHLGSWFDVFLGGTLRAYTGVREHGRSAATRAAQRLIVGPWIHGPANLALRAFGDLDFGPEAVFDLNDWRLRWYDRWLKGDQNGVMDGPPVRVFLMGTNRWLGLPEWPPADAEYRPLHLASGSEPGRGRLTFEAPPADDAADTFTYDPSDPVPSTVTGLQTWPNDQRSIEARQGDVLVYTSEVLTEEMHVVGPVSAVLHAASSAADTDWVVRLCDVWPDGRSITVCDGILRARYRESFERPVLLEADEVYRLTVDLRATAQTFKAGHRLRVHVASSDFPRYDRNLNTGGPVAQETTPVVARNTVFHDSVRPSHLLLPVLAVRPEGFVRM